MSKKQPSESLLSINRLSTETGLDRRTIARHLRGCEPDKVQDGRALYSLETLRAAFAGHPKQKSIPHTTNPIRTLVEWSLDHFHWHQASNLAMVWPEFPVVKKLGADDAERLLQSLRLFLKWHGEMYLGEDKFNAYLASAASGLRLDLDAVAGKLLGAKFDSRPTPVELNLPDAAVASNPAPGDETDSASNGTSV